MISNYLKENTTNVEEGQDGDEYIITRLDHVMPAVNIVNIYGEQESRAGKDRILSSWLRLRQDLKSIEQRGEAVMIIGDMNRAVGADELGVPGNKDKVSYGGELIREMIKHEEYVLINSLSMVVGGPWTWIQRGNPEIRSCLDLGIISSCLIPFLDSVVIDKEHNFTPRRVIKRKGKIQSIFTDHLPIEIKLKGMPRRKRLKIDNPASWNTDKPEGWKIYKEVTDSVAVKMNEIINNNDLSIEEVVKKVETMENKAKFVAFGKTRSSSKKKGTMKVDTNLSQEEKDKELLKRQSGKIEEQINLIKSQKHGRAGNVFKMKEAINGPKKKTQEPSAVKDPTTGELVVSSEEIKKVTLKYCVENLQNNNPDDSVKQLVELKKELHKIRMSDTDSDGFKVGKGTFNRVMNKFGTKKTKAYNFILKDGDLFKDSICTLCIQMLYGEDFPHSEKQFFIRFGRGKDRWKY